MPSIGVVSDGYDYALSDHLRKSGIGEVKFTSDVRLEDISKCAASQSCDVSLVLIADDAYKRLDLIQSLEDEREKVQGIERLASDIVSQLESCEENARTSGGEVLFAFVPTLFSRREREAWQNTFHGSHKFAIRLLNSEIARRIEQTSNITILDGVSEVEARCSKLWFRLSSYWDTVNSEILTSQVKEYLSLRFNHKKIVILDLDNTLWGGILTEDSIDGIQLGKDSVKGRVYQEIHRIIGCLRRNGFLVAICSKNNEEEARDCLYKHYGSLLKEEDIVSERINWKSKADNVRSIADEIGISLDSFIFIDDNYTECNEVEARCQGVDTLVVPRNIYEYPKMLLSSDLLVRQKPSQEDKERTNAYKVNRIRTASTKSVEDGELSRGQWLKSLGMRLELKKLNTGDRAVDRVVQLFSRTNQFNLFYSKYSHADLGRLLVEADTDVYYASLSDRYGCDGIIASMITERIREGQDINILDFVMSCRVFGRGIEGGFLKAVLRQQGDPQYIRFRVRDIGRNSASSIFVDSITCSTDETGLLECSAVLDRLEEDHLECHWT